MAYQSIQEAIEAACCGDRVWVACGTYPEDIVMKSDIQLYGGFVGTEISLLQRNVAENPTIIDANAADAGSPANHVVMMNSITNTRIDGFTITGGDANGGGEDDKGGGIFCNGLDGTNIIVNCKISGNCAKLKGGGMYCGNSSPGIGNCIIGRNSSTSGGGVYCYNGWPIVTNCTFTNNWASEHGGGMLNWGNGVPILFNCTFSGNSTSGSGGGIFNQNSDPILANCTFSGNSAQTGGGVAGDGGSWPLLTNCIISGNLAHYGGGVHNGGGRPWIINCTISGNCAYESGGGVYFLGSGRVPRITNCTISSNWANSGGGVYCSSKFETFPDPAITNTIFEGNTGCAIYEDMADPTITFCLFHNNPDGDYYDQETGVQTGASSINTNVTDTHDNIDVDPLFVMNADYGITGTWTQEPNYNLVMNRTTLTDANALFVEGELVGKLINTNITQRQQALILANTSTTIDALGDLTDYVLTGDTYKIIDYHLQSSSPCVDAGTDDSAPLKDIEGNPRPVDIPGVGADETGTEYDIGAYEAQPRQANHTLVSRFVRPLLQEI